MTAAINTDSMTAKEVEAAWIEALESGRYKQGDGALRRKADAFDDRPDQFCCLGVLCDLVNPAWWELTDGSGIFEFNGAKDYAPSNIEELVGWNELQEGEYLNVQSRLVHMNDGLHMTFPEIAQAVREGIHKCEDMRDVSEWATKHGCNRSESPKTVKAVKSNG